jgi:hypothetical protein
VFRLVYGIVVLGSTIWVASDASNLGARKGATGGGFLDMGPVAWFFACLLLWIIAFPCYLIHRPRLKAARARTGPYGSYPPPQAPWGYASGPTVNPPPHPPWGYATAPGAYPPPPAPPQPWLNGYVPPPEPPPGVCHTCGAYIGGPFCAQCGTPAVPLG